MSDDRGRKRLRADFQQYYGLDLYSFFEEDEVDVARLCCLLYELPFESRLRRDGGLTQSEHLTIDILDSLNRIQWMLVYVIASNGLDPKKMKKPPEPIERPKQDSEKNKPREKPRFLTGRELAGNFNDPRRTGRILARIKKQQEGG